MNKFFRKIALAAMLLVGGTAAVKAQDVKAPAKKNTEVKNDAEVKKLIDQKLARGELVKGPATSTDIKNDKGEVIGKVVKENYFKPGANTKDPKQASGSYSYSQTFEKTTTKKVIEVEAARVVQNQAPHVAAMPTTVTQSTAPAPFKYKGSKVTPEQKKTIEAELRALPKAEREKREIKFKAYIAEKRKKQLDAYNKAHPKTSPAETLPAPIVRATTPTYIPAKMDTVTTTDTKEVIKELQAVLLEDQKLDTPAVVVKKERPFILYTDIGLRQKTASEDALAGTNSRFWQIGAESATLAEKGIGSWVRIDANFRMLKNAPYQMVTPCNGKPGCEIKFGRNTTSADATQYEASMALKLGKELKLDKKDNFRLDVFLQGGPMYRWGPSIDKMTDMGAEMGLGRITPNQKQRDNFVFYGQAGVSASVKIVNGVRAFVQADVFGTTAKPVNATSSYTDEAMAANPYLTNKYPFSKNGTNVVEDARDNKKLFTDIQGSFGVRVAPSELFKKKSRSPN